MSNDLILKNNYKRNFITYMIESFLFSFSVSIFSHSTVLPKYIANLTDNSFYISLISLIFFSLSNFSSVIASIVVSNRKNTKMTTLTVAFLQRVGQLFIYLSVFSVTKSHNLALLTFFTSYSFFAIASGMSMPAFTNLVSKVIYKNISSFYGYYTFFGAISGFIGSFAVSRILTTYQFPRNYQMLYLIALLAAILATIVMIIGIVDSPEKDVTIDIKIVELPQKFKEILEENIEYRKYLVLKMLLAVSDVAIPFYIIKFSTLPGTSESLAGIMSAILLFTTLSTSPFIGRIGDRKGVYFLIRVATIFGIVASLSMLLLLNAVSMYIIIVALGSFINTNGILTSVANIEFSKEKEVAIYTSLTGILISPIYLITSLIGGLLVNRFGIDMIFVISTLAYISILVVLKKGEILSARTKIS